MKVQLLKFTSKTSSALEDLPLLQIWNGSLQPNTARFWVSEFAIFVTT